jgi:hypothetical protein
VRGVIGQWLHNRSLERAMRVASRAPARDSSSRENSADEARRRRMDEVRALLDEGGEAER